MHRATAVLLVASVIAGCRRTHPPEAGTDTGAPSLPPPSEKTAKDEVALDMLEPSPRCRVEHRGALIDLGAPEAAWSTPGRPDAATDVPGFERDGATWGRVLDRSQSFTVALDATGPALVAVRGRARGAKKAIASIDGKVVGPLVLSPTEDRVVSATNASLVLSPGLHTVTLRWVGVVKKDEPLAELDWVRLGTIDGDPSAYSAPTRHDTVMQVAIGGAPRKAIALKAPAVLRCVAWIPPHATLVTDVGAIGEGTDGEVEVRERATGDAAPKVLSKQAASASAWSGMSVPLSVGGQHGSVAIVEIVITRSPKQGRVAIAEPRIVRPHTAPSIGTPKPAAPKAVVVVVMAALGSSHLTLPSLQKLAREGVVYRGHRAPSSLANASVASLVTGLPVPVHALEDPGARLSPRTPLIGKSLTPFGVDTAMFTEAPTTGPAFGFAHDWTHYAARSPLDGGSVAFEEISKYLQQNAGKRVAIFAHARGAHPPWDVAAETLKSLPPEGYVGSVAPGHVVAILAKVRRGLLRLNENDRTRLVALSEVAMAAVDRKLDALIEELRAAGTLDQTLFIVTGDAPFVIPAATATPPSTEPKGASSGSSSTLPVAPAVEPPREEEPLAIPLVVRFPGKFGAGRVVTAVTDPTDVAATVIAAFGGTIVDLAGRDLALLANDDEPARDTARLSDDGRGYHLSWGDIRLVGSWGKTPTLRPRLGGDDLRAKRPFEYLAAWGLAAEARDRWLAARGKGPGREPATIDAMTSAALDSWERSR